MYLFPEVHQLQLSLLASIIVLTALHHHMLDAPPHKLAIIKMPLLLLFPPVPYLVVQHAVLLPPVLELKLDTIGIPPIPFQECVPLDKVLLEVQPHLALLVPLLKTVQLAPPLIFAQLVPLDMF